jgi:hypothetical protein
MCTSLLRVRLVAGLKGCNAHVDMSGRVDFLAGDKKKRKHPEILKV